MLISILLLLLMQLNSMLATGLGILTPTNAMIVRIIISTCILIIYFRKKIINVKLYLFTCVMIFFIILNKNQTIINFCFIAWMIYAIRAEGVIESLKGIYYSTIIFSLFFIIFSAKGILQPELVYIAETGRYRNNMGFLQANYPGFMAFSCFITLFSCVGYLKNNTGRISKYLAYIIMAICFFIPILADSRTPSYAMILSIVFFLTISCNPIRKVCLLILPFMPLILITLTFYISQNHSVGLNDFLSGRPEYYSRYLNLIGDDGLFLGSQLPDFPLDNSYLILLSCFGIFYIPFLMALLYKGIRNNNNKYMLTVTFSILIYGFTEAVMARPEISVIFLYYYLFAINTDKKTIA